LGRSIRALSYVVLGGMRGLFYAPLAPLFQLWSAQTSQRLPQRGWCRLPALWLCEIF